MCRILVNTRGEVSYSGIREARLGEMYVHAYQGSCDVFVETFLDGALVAIWSDETGFTGRPWLKYLPMLRRELLLDSLASD